MAPPTSPPLDPVSLLAAVLVGILAPQTDHQAAAYVVIAASAMLGALWALSRRDPPDGAGQAPRRRLPGWVYVPLVTGSTTLVAAGVTAYDTVYPDIKNVEGLRAEAQVARRMGYGGKIAILGIAPTGFEIDWNKVIFKMLHLKGIYGREMFETWYKMSVMIQSGLDLSPIITHRLPYQKFEEGFETMLEGKSGKIVLNWE